MAIRRPDPIRAIAELQDRMNRLFEEIRGRSFEQDPDGGPTAGWQPPVDLVEHDGGYVLRADLPGVAPDDLRIEVENDVLTLHGERRPESGSSRESFLREERPRGRFEVKLSLPPSVEPSGIRASQRAGVLEVVLPSRRAADRESIRVEVQESEA
jgi:HSP20 family protein